MNYRQLILLLIALAALWFAVPAMASADAGNVADWLKEDPASETEPAEAEAVPEIEEKSFAAIIGQLIFYTLLIAGLIYGLIKFLAMRQKGVQSQRAVQLMGGSPLGQNKSLQLVKVGGQFYLIGVGNEVTLIKEFSGEAEIAALEQDLEQQRPAASALFGNGGKSKESFANFEQYFARSLDKQKERHLSFGKKRTDDGEDQR